MDSFDIVLFVCCCLSTYFIILTFSILYIFNILLFSYFPDKKHQYFQHFDKTRYNIWGLSWNIWGLFLYFLNLKGKNLQHMGIFLKQIGIKLNQIGSNLKQFGTIIQQFGTFLECNRLGVLLQQIGSISNCQLHIFKNRDFCYKKNHKNLLTKWNIHAMLISETFLCSLFVVYYFFNATNREIKYNKLGENLQHMGK